MFKNNDKKNIIYLYSVFSDHFKVVYSIFFAFNKYVCTQFSLNQKLFFFFLLDNYFFYLVLMIFKILNLNKKARKRLHFLCLINYYSYKLRFFSSVAVFSAHQSNEFFLLELFFLYIGFKELPSALVDFHYRSL